MKTLAHIFTIVGLVALPLAYTLLPLSRKVSNQVSSGNSSVTLNPASGFWVLAAGAVGSLVFLVLGFVMLQLCRRKKP